MSAVRTTMRLAWPLAVSQLGLMVMVLVDTWFVGKLGTEAIAGAGLGTSIFYGFSLFGAGVLFALDYFIATAFGRGDRAECHRWLVQGCFLALLLSVPLLGGNFFVATQFERFGIGADVAIPARTFLTALGWSLPPFFLFICFRQYLAAMSSVRATALILVVANVANAALNALLIPSFGIAGSGYATTGTRAVMLAAIVAFTYRRDAVEQWGLRGVRWRPDGTALSSLWRLGFPSGMQMVIRSAVFSVATALVARRGPLSLATHAIVLNLASFVYMIPVGLAAAASVTVGQSLGRRDEAAAKTLGWAAIGLGALIMGVVGIALAVFGPHLVALFSDDGEVVLLGASLMLAVAAFQLADALQTIAIGALRGAGETKSALLANGIGHWAVGLPLGTWLCFVDDRGVHGMWLGLTAGLFVAALVVVPRWWRYSFVSKMRP